jgi:hypothetical protein
LKSPGVTRKGAGNPEDWASNSIIETQTPVFIKEQNAARIL